MIQHRSGGPLRAGALVASAAAFAALLPAHGPSPSPTAVARDGDVARAPTAKAALAESRRLLEGNASDRAEAAGLLKRLGAGELETSDRESWLRLARQAAIQQGDLAWLESLRDVPDRFGLVMIQKVLLASASLAAADFATTRALLAEVGDPELLNEREKRRCYAILARLAQLEGDPERERPLVEKLVDHLHLWPKPICQSCHATLDEPERLTHLKVADLWFGERFVALMRQRGDAEEIRAASEARLARRPGDDRARIRLAFALRALGRPDVALEHFRALPWADFPDRPSHKPRMITSFP